MRIITENSYPVHNVEGTGDQPESGGNKKYWRDRVGRLSKPPKKKRFPSKCCNADCKSKKPAEGAHVMSKTGKLVYIVPLCHACNMKPIDEYMKLTTGSIMAKSTRHNK